MAFSSATIRKLRALNLSDEMFDKVLEIFEGATTAKAKKTADLAARATAIAPDWTPDEDLISYGLELGLTEAEIRTSGEDMRLWAVTNGHRPVARKLNWTLTFKGWLRRDAPKIIRNRPRGPNGGSYGSATSNNGHQPRGASAVLAAVRGRIGAGDRHEHGDPRDHDAPPPPGGLDDYGFGPRAGDQSTLDLRANPGPGSRVSRQAGPGR